MSLDNYPRFSPQTSQLGSTIGQSGEDSAINSAGSFFMPRLLRSSSLEGVLNKGDAKLEDLMEEEDFTYDLKNGNPKLQDYFSKDTGNIRKLIDYVTIMPPDPEDTKRAHKKKPLYPRLHITLYPFIACEVFEADVAPIMNAFFFSHALKASESSPNKDEKDKTSLLEYLFKFVETDQELNPVLAGYFNKVVQVLFKRNPRRMVEFAYEKENLLLTMVNHIKEKSITELLILFLCYDSSQTHEDAPSRLSKKQQVLDKILETLTKSNEENYGEGSINAGNILNEVIQKHNNIVDGKELISYIASSSTAQKLFDALRNAPPTKITSICDVLCGIMRYYSPDAMDFGPSDTYGFGGQSNDQERVMEVIKDNLDVLLAILQGKSDDSNKVETVFGMTVKKIGSGRLKVIEIVQNLVKLDNMDIFERISDLDILKVISDLFKESPWNNILHTYYEQLINTILDKADSTLLKSLFERANLIDIIIGAGQNPEHELPKKNRKVRKGYMGHVIRMANELVRYGNIDDTVERYLKSNRKWDDFVYAILKKQNEINNTQIGGYNPRSLVGNPNMESSFGNLAESQPMMMPASSEGFAAMPSYEDEIIFGERSPNRAGDISHTLPSFDWKESNVSTSVDALVETIFKKTKVETEFSKNQELSTLAGEGIHDIKRTEENELARVKFTQEGRRSFGSIGPDLGPKEEPDTKNQGKSPEKGQRDSLTKSPSKDSVKSEGSPVKEESKTVSIEHLRDKSPSTEEMRKSGIGKGTKKIRLKLKKGEKANPLKILEAIDRYKGARQNLSTSGIEYTFTESSYSESRVTESEGGAVLEDENKEEILARLKEEENQKLSGVETNGVNGIKAGSPEKRS